MSYLIKQAQITNEGRSFVSDLLIKNGRIEKIASQIEVKFKVKEINAEGLWLLPGAIDDQVHFREPGLTHKADIATESKAAIAGGTTSYMEMPNTEPPTLTQELLEQKYTMASQKSFANYSFYMGVSNDNLDEVLRTNPQKVCGLKVFMGSSTGNLLVDNEITLEKLFANAHMLIATHCEDEQTIRKNLSLYTQKYGNNLTAEFHPLIRNHESCYLSSSKAVALAKKYNTRLHVLHISTAKELQLFDNQTPIEKKKITSEICVHHLAFHSENYKTHGNLIKWNPAIKTKEDQAALWKGVLEGYLDVAATDHAPHTFEEKSLPYLEAPSGGPLIQHSLLFWLHQVQNQKITLEKVVQLTAHNPAILFRIEDRGFIREGYYADLVLIDPSKKYTVTKENLHYKCGWSPFEGFTFDAEIKTTFLNGEIAYDRGQFYGILGQRLSFRV